MATITMNDHTRDEIIAFAREAGRDGGDFGGGMLFKFLFDGKLIYDHSIEAWFIWTGHYWVRDEQSSVLTVVLDTLARYFAEATEVVASEAYAAEEALEEAGGPRKATADVKITARHLAAELKQLRKVASDLRNVTRATTTLIAAAGTQGMSVVGSEWDSNPLLMGVQNGVINLRDGSFRPGRPDDYLTKVAPTTYNPSATCPDIEHFLSDIFEDRPEKQEIIDFLMRLFGYMMTGEIKEHVLPIWYGPEGRNGKGTLQRLLAATLGPYIGTVGKAVLLKSDRQKQSGSADADQYSLMGKRAVFVSETNQGDALDPGIVKMLTGGDMIAARPPYGKKVVEFNPTHKVVLVTNHRPYVPADDDAIWNRVVLIPFTMSFVVNPQKPNQRKINHSLEERMQAQTSGFLNLLIAGCAAWRREGLRIPTCLSAATQDYRDSRDTLGKWIEEVAVVHPDARWSTDLALDSYLEWRRVEDKNFKIKRSTFEEQMERHGFKKRQSSTMFYFGIGPRDTVHQIDPMLVTTDALTKALDGDYDGATALVEKLKGQYDREVVERTIKHIRAARSLNQTSLFEFDLD